jgi:hypothetical protein
VLFRSYGSDRANIAYLNQTNAFTTNISMSANKSISFGNNACIFYNGTAIIINNNATGVTCP